MWTYADLEEALALQHNAGDTARIGALRGRVKHFQRLGIPLGVKPGRGKRICYGLSEVTQFVYCLEMAQFGIDPAIIVQIVQHNWEWLSQEIWKAVWHTKSTNNYFYFEPIFMSSTWEKPGVFYGIGQIGVVDKNNKSEFDRIINTSPRVALINLKKMMGPVIGLDMLKPFVKQNP